jgi:hypothetical protein
MAHADIWMNLATKKGDEPPTALAFVLPGVILLFLLALLAQTVCKDYLRRVSRPPRGRMAPPEYLT